jgi:hypothetical protein
MEGASALLKTNGAESIAHPGGTLFAHLHRTAELLAAWNAPEALVLAGLCHATYGTDGFDRSLLDLSERAQLRSVIGPAAEDIVYFYASCDRGFTYPNLGSGQFGFRDRFTGAVSIPERDRLMQFMELTFANEIDVARNSRSFAENIWPKVAALFRRCEPLVSSAAAAAFSSACDEIAQVAATSDSDTHSE